jgi:RNA polymerase sigma-70 factor, ECF subfamily
MHNAPSERICPARYRYLKESFAREYCYSCTSATVNSLDKSKPLVCLSSEKAARRDARLPEQRLSAEDVRQLYNRHGAALLLYARGFVADASAAEDLVHGVFLNLLRTRPKVREAPAAYLYRAVKNAALNLQRNRAREAPMPEQEVWFTHQGGDREAGLALQSALSELPTEQREAVVMRIWGGMTLEEVAEATGAPLNTAASRYRYALEKLRERLKPHERKE